MNTQNFYSILKAAKPIFGFNILNFSKSNDEDIEIDIEDVYLHQLVCYERLIKLFREFGFISTDDWQITAKPLRQTDDFHNQIPVLSLSLINDFEDLLSLLTLEDTELIISVMVSELTRLEILTDSFDDIGYQAGNPKKLEVVQNFFRFSIKGNRLIVKHSELKNRPQRPEHLQYSHGINSRGNTNPASKLDNPRQSPRASTFERDANKITNDRTTLSTHIRQEIKKQLIETLEEESLEALTSISEAGRVTAKNISALEEGIQQIHSEGIAKMRELRQTTESHIHRKLSEVEEQAIARVESVASGIVIDEALKSAFILWDEKKDRHRNAFYIGIGLFIALILIIGGSAYEHFDPILEYLSKIFANTNGTVADVISRIVLITIPIGITIWVLRAVLRWANLNLALAEDAAQRSVMARTYVNLLTSGDVTEDKDDRKVMLEAIFRPLPGIQEMDTAPPSIINFANPSSGK